MQVVTWFECSKERGEDLKVLASFGFDGFFFSFLYLTFWFGSFIIKNNGGLGSRDLGEGGGVEENWV